MSGEPTNDDEVAVEHEDGSVTGPYWDDMKVHVDQENKDLPEPPKDEQHVQLSASLAKYSDELANGDSADNKDLHEEEDTKDHVVDEMGATNRGYGHQLPSHFVAENTIQAGGLFSDHFATIPRDPVPELDLQTGSVIRHRLHQHRHHY